MQFMECGNPMIESVVELVNQKKATQYHGMVLVLLAFCCFTIYRFCLKLARRILRENGMVEERIDYFLNFSKDLDEV